MEKPLDKDDFIVGAVCGLIAIPLCEAGWHAVVVETEATARGVAALAFGLPLGLGGLSFHWWKDGAFGKWALRQCQKWWPAVVVIAFVYFVAPEMYRRAMLPAAAEMRGPTAEEISVAVVGRLPKTPTPPTLEEITSAVVKALPRQLPPPSASEIAAAVAPFEAKLDAANKTIADQNTTITNLRSAQPSIVEVAPDINARATLSMIILLRQRTDTYIADHNDGAQRYLVISGPPNQEKLRQLLLNLIDVAIGPRIRVLQPPDTTHIIDAPKLPIPETEGLVVHGSDEFNEVLQTALRECFKMRQERAPVPESLGDYYFPNKHPIVFWLTIGGSGAPWINPKGCNQ